MRRLLIPLHLIMLVACGDATVQAPPDAIRTMLERSAAAWNAGDLDGFMSSYAADSLTTFVGNRELLHGWGSIRDNYAPLFEPGAIRDSLRFEDMEVRMIDPLHAVGYARWVLVREGAPFRSGPFTLVVEYQSGEWKIVHDHSSEER